MSRILARRRRAPAAVAALLAGATLAAVASTDAHAFMPGLSAASGFQCGYTLRYDLGGMLMEGHIASDRPLAGTYEIRVIRYGARSGAIVTTSGSFASSLGSPASTGTILFGDAYAIQDIQMVLRFNGKRWPCVEMGPRT
ncbi:MAG: hypothetical protein IT545_07665 [Rhodobacteraceae bacterium]|nr:hypothetical protein [Paracoccaceae bacterium]